MHHDPKILLLSGDGPETGVLEAILSEHVNLHSVKTLAQLQSRLEEGSYDAVFCDWAFSDGSWNDALEEVQQNFPDLPVIVFCQSGGKDEWAEVLESGAFALLGLPYWKHEVVWTLDHALPSRKQPDSLQRREILQTKAVLSS